MNGLINSTAFFYSSFELISLIVYMTIGILLFLNVFFSKKEENLQTEKSTFIGISFVANSIILVLRHIFKTEVSTEYIYDLSCVFVILQLFYPLAYHLHTLTEKRVRAALLLRHTLIPLFSANVTLILFMYFNISVELVYLLVGGGILILYSIFRLCQLTGNYCKYLKFIINDQYGMKSETLRLSLVITGALILLITVSNIFMSNINSLMVPSLIVTVVLSVLTVHRIISDEKYSPAKCNNVNDDKTFVISPNLNPIDNYRQNDIKVRLEEYFNSSKPYLNKKISIKDVARRLFTNKTYLSKVINENMGVNFNQYVNAYRMKEVDKLLKEDSHIGMKELCDKAGFGCMATFVVAFRLYKGAPPAEWCKKNAKYLGKYSGDNGDK